MKNKLKMIVPDDLVTQWQGLVDTMAELADVPIGLIMRIVKDEIEVFIASRTEWNPYTPGNREHLPDSGLYCETVIRTRQPLLVPDALSDPKWKNNPDIRHHLISYLGFPILYPDGSPFGTLCILDQKQNAYSSAIYNMLDNFRNLIQSHLALLYMNTMLGEKNRSLTDYLNELHCLRGLIRICAQCKKIRDSDGHWHPVEEYLLKHPEANFTHGYCPECAKKVMDQIDGS